MYTMCTANFYGYLRITQICKELKRIILSDFEWRKWEKGVYIDGVVIALRLHSFVVCWLAP